jgi:hypothetical protein
MRFPGLILVALGMMPGAAMAELYVVVLEGLGGNDMYAGQFAEQVETIEGAAAGLAASDGIRIFRSGTFGRDDVVAHFSDLASTTGSDDRLALFLIGHGSYDDHEYKFNIEGPDLTGTDLIDMLDGLNGISQLVVNTSSSSGATLERLKADHRTLILATRSGAERHATRFGHYFATALYDASADLDKNSIVTAEEAFQFAERQVTDYFERNGQLATEHSKLEGAQAARFSLARLGSTRVVRADTELERLMDSRDQLNSEIDALRLQRDSMAADQYQSALLDRMLELATLEERIEQREAELDDER